MEPALAAGHYLLVSGSAYQQAPPDRGDIIVLRDPTAPDREMVKRVIGLPGEAVRVEPAQVFINGEPLEEPYLKSQAWRHLEAAAEWRLGDDAYLVMGDNRDYSRDSRVFGPVHRGLIVGKVWFRYWPPEVWGRVKHAATHQINPSAPT